MTELVSLCSPASGTSCALRSLAGDAGCNRLDDPALLVFAQQSLEQHRERYAGQHRPHDKVTFAGKHPED